MEMVREAAGARMGMMPARASGLAPRGADTLGAPARAASPEAWGELPGMLLLRDALFSWLRQAWHARRGSAHDLSGNIIYAYRNLLQGRAW